MHFTVFPLPLLHGAGRDPPGRAPLRQVPSIPRPTTSSSQKFMLQPLSLQLELEELWSMLSDCLDALGRTKDSHAVLVLQPLVEAFFLVHADSNDDLKQSTKRRGALLTRTGRLASYHTLGDSDTSPDSPAPAPMDSISPAPGTPRDSELDLYAHLPPDIARFLKFAGEKKLISVVCIVHRCINSHSCTLYCRWHEYCT